MAKLERSSVELSERLAVCTTELDAAIENADLDLMKKLRLEIKELPEQIALKEIAELKTRIGQINEALEQNADTKELLRSVIATRKKELADKLKEVEPFYENLSKAGWEYSFADNDYQMLLQERRDKNSRLKDLTAELKVGV